MHLRVLRLLCVLSVIPVLVVAESPEATISPSPDGNPIAPYSPTKERTTDIRPVRLDRITISASAVKATESGFLEFQRRSTLIGDGITAQLMGAMSASDAGDALKRVTGMSIVGGKYVYVRGLGERYSTTLLNNVQIPSPEPNRRVIPMDMLPANLLESIQTLKTFSPDLPGDFSGGSVVIVTKDSPEQPMFSLGLSTGANSEAASIGTFAYEGGASDYFGYDDGTRTLPSLIASKAKNSPVRERGIFSTNGFTKAEIQEFGRSFNNVWSPKLKAAPSNQGISFSVGNTHRARSDDFGGDKTPDGKEYGYLAVVSLDSDAGYRVEERNTYRMGLLPNGKEGLTLFTGYDVIRTTRNASLGSMLNGSIRLSPTHKLNLKTIYNHGAEDEARTWEGFNSDRNTNMRSSRMLHVERGLLSSQLSGDHTLNGLGGSLLTWRTVFSRATRLEPDTREVVYEERDGKWLFRDITQSGSRFFFDLADNEYTGMLDWTLPLTPRYGRPTKVKFGSVARVRYRNFDARRFRFHPSDNIEEFVDLSAPPEELFRPENIAPGRFELLESTRPTDNYEASQDLLAGYVLADLPLHPKWDLLTGVRVEASDQTVTTFDPFSPTAAPIVAELNRTDALPSVNLVYRMAKRINLRTAFSKTVTRPDLREMAPFEFTDFIGGRTELGNPALDRTKIDNYDARWEFFPRMGELMAVSVFYKQFHKPIEQVIQPAAEVRITYENALAAKNYGIEAEVRRRLDTIHPSLEHFSVNTNLTLVRSNVVLSDFGAQTSKERPLQGQSPYVVNASVGYDHPHRGMNGSLLFHVAGRRIDEVGDQGSPDVYEEPRPMLDVTLGRRLTETLRMRLHVKNLLNAETIYRQGSEIALRYHTGRSYGFSFNYEM